MADPVRARCLSDHEGWGVEGGAAGEDTVRDVIHAFNERGLAALDPRWAGGRPRLIGDDDIAFVVTTATTRCTGACGNLPLTSALVVMAGGLSSAVSGCARSCASTTSASSRPGRGRSPTTRTRTPSSTASSK
jgi:hypothetical protein